MALKKPTAQEFYNLSWKQKTYYLTAWYLDRCTEEQLFVNGRPSKTFGQIRGYFTHKVEPSKLQVLYDYIASLDNKRITSIYDLYIFAERYQGQLRLNSGDRGECVAAYDSLLSHLDKL